MARLPLYTRAPQVISKEHEDNTTEAIAEEVRVLRAVSTSLQYSSSFTKLQAVYEVRSKTPAAPAFHMSMTFQSGLVLICKCTYYSKADDWSL